MSDLIRQIQTAQRNAGEEAAIAGIPRNLLDNMKRADEEFAKRGGCPGCGSMSIGVHKMPCSWCAAHPFD